MLLLLPLAPTTTAAIITATTILLLSLLLYCCHHGYYPTANNLLFSPDQSLIRLCMITLLPFLNRIFPQSVTLPTLITLPSTLSLLLHTNYTSQLIQKQTNRKLQKKTPKLLVLYSQKLNDWSAWYIIIITPLQFGLLYNKHSVLSCRIVG